MDIAINLGWLSLSILLGAFALFIHNNLLPYLYLIFVIGASFAHLYFACTRCVYYDKDCYILGGRAAKLFFKGRREGPMDPDDSIVSTIWFLLAIFPVPFLLYYQDWLLLLIYLLPTIGWFYNRKKSVCINCGNAWCPNKPK